jgi:hypothetical protein
MSSSTGHLAMSQILIAVLPIPSSRPSCQAAGGHDRDRGRRQQDHDDYGDPDADGQGLPDWPALGDVVDGVGGAHEGGDVAGRQPQRGGQAEQGQHPGRAAGLPQVFDRGGQDLVD